MQPQRWHHKLARNLSPTTSKVLLGRCSGVSFTHLQEVERDRKQLPILFWGVVYLPLNLRILGRNRIWKK